MQKFFSYLLSVNLFLTSIFIPFYNVNAAGIVGDSGAHEVIDLRGDNEYSQLPDSPRDNRLVIDEGQNGTAVINITQPNERGISHNKFLDFNVPNQGVVMNNSLEMGNSHLAGSLYANPNFDGNSAQVILNEVTSSRSSNLLGPTEIFGDSARYILSNPYGITCNGCGFINTPRVTLTTGQSMIDKFGDLLGFNVSQGEIAFEGDGLNYVSINGEFLENSKIDYFDIISKTAKINAKIVSEKEINIIAGSNEYNYQDGTYESKGETGQDVNFAIDASQLGSMYSGKIALIATDKGVGVNSEGDLIANLSDVVINAEGQIVNNSDIYAAQNVAIKSAEDSIKQNAVVYAEENVNLEGVDIENQGSVVSAGNVDIEVENNFNNESGQVIAGESLSFSNNRNSYQHEGVFRASEVDIDVGSFSNEGDIFGLNKVSIDMLGGFNYGGSNITSDGLLEFLLTGGFTVDSGALLRAGAINVEADQDIVNYGTIEAFNRNDQEYHNLTLAAGGQFLNKSNARVNGFGNVYIDASNIVNDYQINAYRDLWLEANNITNNDLFFSNNSMFLDGNYIYNNSQILSLANLIMGRHIDESGSVAEKSKFIENYRADIDVHGNLLVRAEKFENEAYVETELNYDAEKRVIGTREEKYCDSAQYFGGCWDGWKYRTVDVYEREGWDIDYAEEIVEHDEAKISVGGDIDFQVDEFYNQHSVISAGGDINISGDLFDNQSIELERKFSRYVGHCNPFDSYCDPISGPFSYYTEEEESDYVYDAKSVVKAEGDISIDGYLSNEGSDRLENYNVSSPNSGGGMSESEADGFDSDIDGVVEDYVGGGSLYDDEFDEDSKSLISINLPEGMIDMNEFMGSDYLCERLGCHQIKDNAEKIVNSQRTRFLGDAFFDTNYILDQIFSQTGEKYLGQNIASDYEQMLYLMNNAVATAGDLNISLGTHLTAEQIKNLNQDIVWLVEEEYNGHKVLVPKLYLSSVTKENIQKFDGNIISGENIFIAGSKLENSGAIIARNSLNITSDEVVNNTFLNNNEIGNQAILKGRNINIETSGDFLNQGADIVASKDMSLKAAGDVSIVSLENELNIDVRNHKERKVTNHSSNISVGGDLNIDAGKDFNLIASNITASGDAKIAAKEDINIFSGTDIHDKKTTRKNSGFFSSSKKVKEENKVTNIASSISSGGNISFESGNDLNVVGSDVTASGNIDSDIGGNINIVAGKEVNHTNVTETHNTTLLVYNESRGSSKSEAVTSSRSSNFSAGGNLNLNSSENINVVGSNLAAKDINLSAAENVNIIEDQNNFSTSESSYDARSLITGVVNAANIQNNSKSQTIQTAHSSVIYASGNLSIDSGQDTVIKGSLVEVEGDANLNAGGDILISAAEERLSSGSNSSEFTAYFVPGAAMGADYKGNGNSQNSTSHKGSVLNIGGNLQANAKNNIDIVGSDIEAQNNIALNAGGELNIRDAESNSSSNSDSFNASVSGTGFSLGAAGSQSSSTSSRGSSVRAGNVLDTSSQGDTNIIASNVSGGEVVMDVGGDLNVISKQNTSGSNNSSAGFSVSEGGFGANVGAGNASRKWVDNQASITSDGKLRINVSDNSHLEAGLINSENGDMVLNTETITFADIKNSETSEQSGVGLDVTYDQPETKDAVAKKGSSTMGLDYTNNDKRGITRATIGGGTINTGSDISGLNRDVEKVQEITQNDSTSVSVKLPTDVGELKTGVDREMERYGDQIEGLKERVGELAQGDFQGVIDDAKAFVDNEVEKVNSEIASIQENYNEAKEQIDDFLGGAKMPNLSQPIGEVFAEAKTYVEKGVETYNNVSEQVSEASKTIDNLEAGVASVNRTIDGLKEGRLDTDLKISFDLTGATAQTPEQTKQAGENAAVPSGQNLVEEAVSEPLFEDIDPVFVDVGDYEEQVKTPNFLLDPEESKPVNQLVGNLCKVGEACKRAVNFGAFSDYAFKNEDGDSRAHEKAAQGWGYYVSHDPDTGEQVPYGAGPVIAGVVRSMGEMGQAVYYSAENALLAKVKLDLMHYSNVTGTEYVEPVILNKQGKPIGQYDPLNFSEGAPGGVRDSFGDIKTSVGGANGITPDIPSPNLFLQDLKDNYGL